MSKVKSEYGKGIEICVSWIDGNNEYLHPRTVKAGESCFVIRAEHNGEYIPGKYVIGHHSVYICYDGEEIPKSDYQMLVHTNVLGDDGLEWRPADGNTLPKDAIIGGTDKGFPLYIIRSDIDGEVAVGKFFPQHLCGYIPHAGKEHRKDQFEVLCCTKKSLQTA